jgi:RimJ/RimL family protein N-acetyltransferase
MKMEKTSLELIKFLPEVDLTEFKPYKNSKLIPEAKRLRPEHALQLQKALNKGTDHIAGYFAWGETASRWNTKQTLSWIFAQLKEEWPAEHFAFFLGKDLIGMGSLKPYGHVRKVQMVYWVSKGFLKQGIGECIAMTLEKMALIHRPYQFIYVNHDNSNKASGAIPKKLGYEFIETFTSGIHARKETGIWSSWMKESTRYSDCENERLMDLRYAELWCLMMQEMHPEIFLEMYVNQLDEARSLFIEEKNNVRTNNQEDVA